MKNLSILAMLLSIAVVSCSDNDDSGPKYHGNISEYGVYINKSHEVVFTDKSLLITEKEFKSIFVGHKLSTIEAHQVEVDGKIHVKDYYEGLIGISRDDYLFDDKQCHVLGTSVPGGEHYDIAYDYTYDKTCNTTGPYPRFTLLTYDKKTKQATFLTRTYGSFVLETFQLLPKE